MTQQQRPGLHQIPIRQSAAITLAAWSILLAGSLAWNLWIEHQAIIRQATIEADANFNKDLAYRRWTAKQGGVYVPITEHTPPNPYLSRVPNRDVTTLSGLRLTLVNPAYMTRQVHELSAEQYGVRGHITSLTPLRPENRADAWEDTALQAFEHGVKEVSSVAEINGKPYLRFMRPFMVEASCLKCHADQGYKVGDVRGGISVSVPMNPYYEIQWRQSLTLSAWHLLIYLAGSAGLLLGAHRLQEKVRENEANQNALQAKQEELALFRALIDQSNDAVFIIDPTNGLCLDVNERANQALGYNRTQLLTLTVMDIDPLIPDLTAWQAHAQVMRERGQMILTSHHRRQDGTLFPAEVNIRYLVHDRRDYIVATARDITERRQTEEELSRYQTQLEAMVAERTEQLETKTHDLEQSQQALLYLIEDVNEVQHDLEAANQRLKELDRLKSLFIASMSHELRTPLNSIIGFSAILLDEWAGPLTPEQKQNQATILRNGKHLLALINDVIDVSTVEAGMVESTMETFPLDALLAEAMANFDAEAKGKGLPLNLPSASGLTMTTDRRRLLQCLLNLIGNAVKFTDHGGITVMAAAEAEGRVSITVQDTGIGISQEDQGRLFIPFARLHPANSKYPGTGLGLYLSRKLITEVLAGTLTVHSIPGQGSTFTITIPTRRAA